MTYTAMMAHSYGGDPHSVVGWYASRKLNGNRAIWNGYVLQTLGRYSGSKVIYPPAWWVATVLPKGRPLDGELWHITDDKDILRSIVGQGIGKSVVDPRWADIRYVVFDYKPYCMYNYSGAPLDPKYSSLYMSNHRWVERQGIIQETVLSHNNNIVGDPLLIMCEQTLVGQSDDPICGAKHIIENSNQCGWEGVVFANPNGMYECVRSHNLLKSKPLFDHECYVNGFEPGEGKYLGMVGSLKCFLTWNEQVLTFKGGRHEMIGNRVSFKVSGMDDSLRSDWMEHLPHRIRFSFLEVSKFGIPQSPNYLGGI
jgi:DNA ligase 1